MNLNANLISSAVYSCSNSNLLHLPPKSQFLHLYYFCWYAISFCFQLIINLTSFFCAVFSLLILFLTFSVIFPLSGICFAYEKYVVSGKMWYLNHSVWYLLQADSWEMSGKLLPRHLWLQGPLLSDSGEQNWETAN